MYTFRIRLRPVRGFTGLDLEGNILLLPARPNITEQVQLQTWSPHEKVRDTTNLLLLGEGYETSREAHAASEDWRGQLQIALAHANLGADFGERHDRQLSDTGRTFWNESPLNGVIDYAVHGLVIYPTGRGPTGWMHLEVGRPTGVGFAPPADVFDAVSRLQVSLSRREQISFNLYSASFNIDNPDARLLTIKAALETLAPPAKRDDSELLLLDDLITVVDVRTDISIRNRESLRGGINSLRNKSFAQRLRSLWPLLDGQEFGNRRAEQAFQNAYSIRNKIVHTPASGVPQPWDVIIAAFELQNVVAALLSHSVRELLNEIPASTRSAREAGAD